MPKQYIVVIEIERKGFIVETVFEIRKAKKYLTEIFQISEIYGINEMYKVEKHIDFVDSYQIKANNLFLSKAIYSTSNGVLSVHIIEKNRDFCLKTFIKERENNPSAIEWEAYPSKADKLLDMFPNFDDAAN